MMLSWSSGGEEENVYFITENPRRVREDDGRVFARAKTGFASRDNEMAREIEREWATDGRMRWFNRGRVEWVVGI